MSYINTESCLSTIQRLKKEIVEPLRSNMSDLEKCFLMPDSQSMSAVQQNTIADLFTPERISMPYRHLSDDEFVICAATAYFGPDNDICTQHRLHDIIKYVNNWRDGRFRSWDLATLVFTYGLGIGRNQKAGLDKNERSDVWANAEWALLNCLIRFEHETVERLQRLSVQVNRPNGNAASSLRPVLLGQYDGQLVDAYIDQFPGANRKRVARRHKNWHMLSGWLKRRDQSWPSPQFDKKFYPLTRHVFRAFVGDRPEHPEGFAKGMLYCWLRQNGDPLRVIRVLRCCGRDRHPKANDCNALFGSFDYCDVCGTDYPYFRIDKRIETEYSQEFAEERVSRCTFGNCQNFCQLGVAICKSCEAAGYTKRNCNRRIRPITVFRRVESLSNNSWIESIRNRNQSNHYQKNDSLRAFVKRVTSNA